MLGKTESTCGDGKVVAVAVDPDTVAFSSPASELYYKGGVRLASLADAALVIVALAGRSHGRAQCLRSMASKGRRAFLCVSGTFFAPVAQAGSRSFGPVFA